MAKDDYAPCSFRLNLNNPSHLKVYRVLSDLNLEIHKSKTNFIIAAILSYIGVKTDAELTNQGAKELEERKGYATREELYEMESRITVKVMKEVAEIMSKAALANQETSNSCMTKQNMPQSESSTESNKTIEEKPDATLEEMSLMFANGDFGEEM